MKLNYQGKSKTGTPQTIHIVYIAEIPRPLEPVKQESSTDKHRHVEKEMQYLIRLYQKQIPTANKTL